MSRKLSLIVLVFGLLSTGLAVAQSTNFFFRNGDRVVFLGDSITQQRLYTTYIEAYTLTRFPAQSFIFRNAGWSGDTAWLRRRYKTDEKVLFAAQGAAQKKLISTAVEYGLARDVLSLKPTVVTVDFGMNDHGYKPFSPDIFKAYILSQQEIIKILNQNGARVALLTPQPIEDVRIQAPDPRNLSLRKFSDGLKDLATNGAAIYVDQFDPYLALMMKARAAQTNAMVGGGDAVHPGPPGQTIMAWSILKGLGAPAEVSSAELDVRRLWGRKVLGAKNCKISKMKYANDTFSFQRLDAALPMPIDARALPALSLAPIIDELSRYDLNVMGLKADQFDVKIDGEKVATVSREDLEKGWNMATLQTGPIAKQTQAVLALVFAKNNLFFTRWRDCQLSPDPKAQQKIAELDIKIAEKEAELNAARLPKPHHFELSPVGTPVPPS